MKNMLKKLLRKISDYFAKKNEKNPFIGEEFVLELSPEDPRYNMIKVKVLEVNYGEVVYSMGKGTFRKPVKEFNSLYRRVEK